MTSLTTHFLMVFIIMSNKMLQKPALFDRYCFCKNDCSCLSDRTESRSESTQFGGKANRIKKKFVVNLSISRL